eukprot:TRINITY_DN46949_c0_g1_i1.p1 TRINITY_DN46949_c0_g1~~TRINITY_DN46949_c0_g1_i1.p1  ORF type:complete len:771 (+),score=252.56 TRINITY_DN46949_c0_g1_i1:54-2366(+)
MAAVADDSGPLGEEEFELEARVARLLKKPPPVRKSTLQAEDPFAGWPEEDPDAKEWGARWRAQDPLERIPLPYNWDPNEQTCVCNQQSVVLWVFGEKFRPFDNAETLLKAERDRRDAIACQELRGWAAIASDDDAVTGLRRLQARQKAERERVKEQQQLLFSELKGRSDVVFAEGLLRHPGFLLRTIAASRGWAAERAAREMLQMQELRSRSRLHLTGLQIARNVAEGSTAADLAGGWAATDDATDDVKKAGLLGMADYAVHPRWRFNQRSVDSGAALATLRTECAVLRAGRQRIDAVCSSLLGGTVAEAAADLLCGSEDRAEVLADDPELLATALTQLHRDRLMRSRWRKGGGPPFLLLAELPRAVCSVAVSVAVARFVRAREGLPGYPGLEADEEAVGARFASHTVALLEGMWLKVASQELSLTGSDDLTAFRGSPSPEDLSPQSDTDWPSPVGSVRVPCRPMLEGGLSPLWSLSVLDAAEREGLQESMSALAARHAARPEEADSAAATQLCAALALRDIVTARATTGGFLRRQLAARAAEAGGCWEELLTSLQQHADLLPVAVVVQLTVAWFRRSADPLSGVTREDSFANTLREAMAAPLPSADGADNVAASHPASVLSAALWLSCTEPSAADVQLRCGTPTGHAAGQVISAAARCGALFGPKHARAVAAVAGYFLGPMQGLAATDSDAGIVLGLAAAKGEGVPLLAARELAHASLQRLRLRHLCHCVRLHDCLLDSPTPLRGSGLGPYCVIEGEVPQRDATRPRPR